MNSIREQVAIAFQVGIFLMLWIVFILVSGIPLEINWAAVKLLPDVISVYAVLYLLFVKWLWRIRLFRGWLVVVPDLQGTWRGTLETTWVDQQSGETPDPIEAYLTIRQTLRDIHITMFTKESVSNSEATGICTDEDKGIRLLSYSYSNTPRATVRERSQIHYGAIRLRITLRPDRKLEGEYWTDRKSTGHAEFRYISRKLIEQFPG